MGSLCSFNCRVKYILCVINIFTKYACVKPFIDKKRTLEEFLINMVTKTKP